MVIEVGGRRVGVVGYLTTETLVGGFDKINLIGIRSFDM